MPVYQIPDEQFIFPHPSLANPDGLIGIGSDLHPKRLLLAYQNGIFPWNNAGEQIHWWCITPRLILYPEKIRISKSMRSCLNDSKYSYSFDKDFLQVMLSCKTITRPNQSGSWIHQRLVEAFLELHQHGFAHSVEVWEDDQLIGGLYGLAIGKMFCGESMFAKKPNASKYALIKLTKYLVRKEFHFIDCQQDTNHLRSLGAELISGEAFFHLLSENKKHPIRRENWMNEN